MRIIRAYSLPPLVAFSLVLLLVARPLHAEVRVVETGPTYLRISYKTDKEDFSAAMGRNRLVGIPLEGKVELKIIEAQIAGHLQQTAVDEILEDLQLDGPAFLGTPGLVRNQRVVPLVFAPHLEEDGRILVYT